MFLLPEIGPIEGVDTMNKLGLMTRAAASLDPHSQTVIYPGLSDAIRSSLDAVASLRSALAGCEDCRLLILWKPQ